MQNLNWQFIRDFYSASLTAIECFILSLCQKTYILSQFNGKNLLNSV